MIIVDTHCHAGNNWFEPVELLLFQMSRNEVDKGVLIQHRGTHDAGYLLECARRFPGRFSVVVIVDGHSRSICCVRVCTRRDPIPIRLLLLLLWLLLLLLSTSATDTVDGYSRSICCVRVCIRPPYL